MARRGHLIIGIAACMAAIVTSSAIAQTATAPAATMPSDAELHDGLESLLRSLGARQLDFGLDGLTEAKARTLEIRRAIDKYSRELRKRGVDEAGQKLLERDLVSLRNDVSPRLSGRVVRIGNDLPVKKLADAQPFLQQGDLVLLGAGSFELAPSQGSAPLVDVAIVGEGAMKTTIKAPRGGAIEHANRLLLDGLRIDCSQEPIVDLRVSAGGVMLRNCELFNYNNGHGGAYGLTAHQGVVWIERCVFEGASGTMNPEHGLGFAMRLSNDVMLVARECQFVDNRSLGISGAPAVFDRCTVLNALGRADPFSPSSQARVWLRESDSMIEDQDRGAAGVFPLVHACDDVAFIEYVLDRSKPIDEDSKQFVEALALSRRLPYWIGLVHHPVARIRRLAKDHLEGIANVQITLPEQEPEADRLSGLGGWMEIEREYARLMDWFDANRANFQWNQERGRYEIVEGKPK